MGLSKKLLERQRAGRRARISKAMPNASLPTIDYFVESDEFNAEVRAWIAETQAAMVHNVQMMTGLRRHFMFRKLRFSGGLTERAEKKNKTKKLGENIRNTTKKNGYMGQIERISFQFPLHGIWLHHGVSRGHHPGNPRRKVDWFNSLIDQKMPALADIAVKYYADAAVGGSMKIH